ncbi:hypothetical protein [Paenibacillus rigui]|uniref:Uncharacterized protein n=1 Tax=Paenibacillus rigui TaxID=554312 RepID=A0A229UXN6_9BACL|nr:hypothetical protein [Paenibacillus rigui]OXM87729.1 hypothetical protein CF651_00995 [Paenibacillus rigui]
MSAYQQFQAEKEKLDAYAAQQFRITAVQEDLTGTLLTLEHPGGERVTLRLETADARKYFVSVMLRQKTKTPF